MMEKPSEGVKALHFAIVAEAVELRRKKIRSKIILKQNIFTHLYTSLIDMHNSIKGNKAIFFTQFIFPAIALYIITFVCI